MRAPPGVDRTPGGPYFLPMRYFLMHLGCQMNASDTERIAAVLEGLGFVRTENEDEADLLGVVACSVRQKAIDRVYGRIHAWNHAKHGRVTMLSGCVLEADERKFSKLFDLIFRMPDLPRLPELLAPLFQGRGGIPAAETPTYDPATGFWQIDPHYANPFQAFIPIQNGCNKFCSYCAVPYTRGREVSRPSAEILAEARRLVADGYRTITLLGQNVNSYGLDRKGAELTFPALLEAVAAAVEEAGKEVRLYYTSPHPQDMSEELFRVMAAHACIAKQVHLPIQSGDDAVLKAMHRSYDMARFREITGWMRRHLPGATFFTDIIVGFPRETEAQFENTRKTMEEFRYDMAYIAMYSPRPGAASARAEDTVPHEEKRRRLHLLSDDLKRISLENNSALVGRTLRVLVEGPDRKPGFLSGKTEGLLIVRFPAADEALTGSFVDVKITGAAPLSMEGTLT